ncbi:trypsin-like serine peptidase [Microlunatus ginsengisoli]|uniref:Peptidase n=1 Tax=Microlunatus ginsengisoli TaxID=363863 RepID=A0ABP6ZV74_9ACTN
MGNTRARVSVFAALAAAATAASILAIPSTANADPTPQSPKYATVSHPNTLTPAAKKLMKGTGVAAEANAVADYWTPARMKAAKSLDNAAKLPGAAPKQQSATVKQAQGPAVKIAPGKAAAAPRAVRSPSTIAPQYWYPNLPYYYPAARTNGKVFFTRGGLNYVCSGSIVNSEGKSLVWTAGHCVADGQVWDSNFAFVPSYSNGSRPYGTWYARQLTTTSAWFYNRDFTQDVGAATMNRNFGYRIADYLGAQGLMWNQSANYYACAFGYPQAAPFTGAYLVEACGNTGNPGNGTIYMYSGLTGGSSGGPWFRNFDGNWGYVNGHNDFIYTNSPAYMYSPYYGNQVASLYNAVRYQTS